MPSTTFQRKLAKLRKTWADLMNESPQVKAVQPKVTYSILDKLGVVYDDLTDEQKDYIDEIRAKVAAGQILNTSDHDSLSRILSDAI